jgi:hypothetical protein
MTFPNISSRNAPECSQDNVTEPGNTTETPLVFSTKPSHSRTHTFHTHSSRATPPPNQTINLLAIIPKTTKSPRPRELLTCTNIPKAIKTPSPTPITHTTLPLPPCSWDANNALPSKHTNTLSLSPHHHSKTPARLIPNFPNLANSTPQTTTTHTHSTPLHTHKTIPTSYKQPAQC